MRTTFTTSFYCKEAKADRKGYAPIQVVIIINGERFSLNTPRKAIPGQFKKDMDSKRCNDTKDYVEAIKNNINKAITDIISKGLPLTKYTLKDYIQNGGIKSFTIENLFEEYINNILKGSKITKDTYGKYVRVKETFLKHVNKDRDITTINVKDIQTYYNVINQTYKTSTTAGMMTKLRTIIKYALANGYMTIDPFATIHVQKGKPVIEYLTDEEMDRIKNKAIDNQRLDNVRRLAILQANTGLSYADLVVLKEEDIKCLNGTYYINKPRVKTGVEYTAVILPEGVEIIKQGLPKVITNQRYNTYLTELGDICGIKKNLHSHIFRKTYATRLLNRGVKMDILQKSLGHLVGSNITTTYYAKYETNTIIDAITKAI